MCLKTDYQHFQANKNAKICPIDIQIFKKIEN